MFTRDGIHISWTLT
uniref:Uncharacterized protein n=1 Tax=Anguilla anguilla TaxID=7936 RepID=A0A0E9QMX2_ANGAN